jgi:hypothetical protein
MEQTLTLINLLVVLSSMIATVYLSQNKLPNVQKALKLGSKEMTCFRGLVTITNAAQLATLLSPATIAVTALNTLLLINKLYISKKLLNMRPE